MHILEIDPELVAKPFSIASDADEKRVSTPFVSVAITALEDASFILLILSSDNTDFFLALDILALVPSDLGIPLYLLGTPYMGFYPLSYL